MYRQLMTLGPGQFFGETGLLRGIPCTATVRVSDDCPQAEALVLDAEGFAQLINSNSRFHQALYQRLASIECAEVQRHQD